MRLARPDNASTRMPISFLINLHISHHNLFRIIRILNLNPNLLLLPIIHPNNYINNKNITYHNNCNNKIKHIFEKIRLSWHNLEYLSLNLFAYLRFDCFDGIWDLDMWECEFPGCRVQLYADILNFNLVLN